MAATRPAYVTRATACCGRSFFGTHSPCSDFFQMVRNKRV